MQLNNDHYSVLNQWISASVNSQGKFPYQSNNWKMLIFKFFKSPGEDFFFLHVSVAFLSVNPRDIYKS